jgi:hypothetical protein
MAYALLVYGDPSAPAPETVPEGVFDDWGECTRALREAGVLLAGDGLAPAETATTVRHRDGGLSLTDGPFAETKEQLLGFYLIDVPDLDEAIDIASRVPGARTGSIEIRPLVEWR